MHAIIKNITIVLGYMYAYMTIPEGSSITGTVLVEQCRVSYTVEP